MVIIKVHEALMLMQAARPRHHFPRDTGLFLPLGTETQSRLLLSIYGFCSGRFLPERELFLCALVQANVPLANRSDSSGTRRRALAQGFSYVASHTVQLHRFV